MSRPPALASRRREHDRHEEERPIVDVDMWCGASGVDEVDDREDDGGGEERLECARDDLLEADHPDRDRRQDAVLDLLRDAELLHERQRDRLDPLEVDRDGDQAGDEDGRERDAARAAADPLADLREDVREDEDEEQRLHDRAQHELPDLSPEHADIAGQHRAERRQPAHSRYSRPVRFRKTVSRLGGWLATSRTSSPAVRAASTRLVSTGPARSVRTRIVAPSRSVFRSPRLPEQCARAVPRRRRP